MKKMIATLLNLCLFLILTYADEDQKLFYSVSRSSRDSESYSNIAGYNVVFPDVILGKYKRVSITVGLGLSNKITKDEATKIQDEMLNAIDNNDAFNRLSDYKPYRETGAFYTYEGKTLVLATMPKEYYYKVEEIDKDTVDADTNNTDIVYGKEILHWRVVNSGEDKIGMLSWEKGSIQYIVFYLDKIIEENEAVNIAKEILG